jgi:hypothetical protein
MVARVSERRSGPQAPLRLANPMKSSALLLVASILPLLSFTGPAFSGRSSAPDRYAYPSGPYPDRSNRGPYYAPYDEGALGFWGGDGMRESRGMPGWYPEPPGADSSRASWPDGYADSVPGRGYAHHPSPYECAPYCEDRFQQQDEAALWDDRYPGQLDMSRERPAAATDGYRFRGDDPAGFGRWGAAPHRNGYQFRPLTEKEQERMRPTARWRMRRPSPSGERPRRRDPLPQREAYGYQSDGWFNRYYGERP